jgi:senataxin
MKMLSEHSSKYPAPKEGYMKSHRPTPEVKSEPGIKQEVKQEVRQEVKKEPGLAHHAKRELSETPEVKPESNGDDFDMFGAQSDTASNANTNTHNSGSGRSTPGTHTRSSPVVESDRASTPNDVLGGMRGKPKIKKRPKPSGPFIDNRPKRPRTG